MECNSKSMMNAIYALLTLHSSLEKKSTRDVSAGAQYISIVAAQKHAASERAANYDYLQNICVILILSSPKKINS